VTISYVVIAVLVVLVVAYILINNSLIGARNKCDEAWSGIDVQLKRRHDLVPNLVETVKGYAAHEQQTLTRVTDARAGAVAAENAPPGERAQAGVGAERSPRRHSRGGGAVPAAAGGRQLPAAPSAAGGDRGRDPGVAADLQLERPDLQHARADLPELDRRGTRRSPPA
jgi:LemA family